MIYAAGGLVIGIVVMFLFVSVITMQNNRRGRKGRETEPRRKFEYSKLILALLLIPYFYAVYIGAKVVLIDTGLLPVLLCFVAAPTSAAIGFYSWKAKAENIVKIKKSNPEETARVDITTLSPRGEVQTDGTGTTGNY